MPKYYGCPCEGCGKPLTLQDDIVVCPDCGAPYHRDCYESSAAASMPRPTPPDTSGSSLIRKVSCAPALPAASAPCAVSLSAAAAVRPCPRRGHRSPPTVPIRMSTARSLITPPFTASSRRPGPAGRPAAPDLSGGFWQGRGHGRHSLQGLGGFHRPGFSCLPERLLPDAAVPHQDLHELFGHAVRPVLFLLPQGVEARVRLSGRRAGAGPAHLH